MMAPESERQVKLAAKMYEARDTARFVWGADYQKNIRDVIETIKVIQQQRRETFLETCIFAAKKAEEAGQTFYSIAVIAAAVEEAEPSTEAV